MPILKQRREQGYTIIPNAIIESKELNMRDIGLLIYLLHLPDDWDFSLSGLVASISKGKADVVKDKRDGVMASLARIEKAGYLSRKRNRDDSGKYTDTVWTISDYPMSDSPKSDFPTLAQPTLANPKQINTNITNKETNTITNEERRTKVNRASPDSPLTPDELKISFPVVDTMGGKPKTTMKKVKEMFGEELAEEAVDIVTWYIEQLYPYYHHKEHRPITQAAKAEYAFRLLRMSAEMYADGLDTARYIVEYAAEHEKQYDPQINLITRPHALGHWLLESGAVYFCEIKDTRYDFEQVGNEEMPCENSLVEIFVRSYNKSMKASG